jgi:hypothetical protein
LKKLFDPTSHCRWSYNVSICKWLHPPAVEQKIDFKNKELHEVNQKIIKHEYVGKAIAQSEVLLQQKHPAVTPKCDNLKVVAEGKQPATLRYLSWNLNKPRHMILLH